jgi:hypothetical protein
MTLEQFGEQLDALTVRYQAKIREAHEEMQAGLRQALREFLGRDLADDVIDAPRKGVIEERG